VNVKRIGWILLAVAGIAVAVFILFVIFSGGDAATWRMFSVCMPVAGVCFTGAAIAAFIDYIRKR